MLTTFVCLAGNRTKELWNFIDEARRADVMLANTKNTMPFLDDSKRLVLMGDWNAILDPKIDKVRRGASRLGRCESSLVGFVTRHGLVDRFRLDHPGREMWTWLDSSPSAKVGSYLDRVLVRRADIDFVSCPTFHLIAWTDHKLIRISLRLVNRPSLAGYWKFNTSLLEIRDFRDRLESLIQRALVGAVTGNRWWASLKHRIRDLATKYGRQLNLDRMSDRVISITHPMFLLLTVSLL